jgi:Asp-tRNA(Asn)/Glu-tRNA(Gln) amidotransferase C subunit
MPALQSQLNASAGGKRSFSTSARAHSSRDAEVQLDDTCVPLAPTWRVSALIEEARRSGPELTTERLRRLLELSALQVPQDEAQLEKLRLEMQELVNLVDAVRSAPLPPHLASLTLPDARIWPEGQVQSLDEAPAHDDSPSGVLTREQLLGNAKRVERDQFVVRTGRRQSSD